MSAPLSDNALLRCLQDKFHNYYQTVESLRRMYTTSATIQPDPLDPLKDKYFHHCFFIFDENEDIHMVAAILHHMARYPS